jgi:hypothetical protein
MIDTEIEAADDNGQLSTNTAEPTDAVDKSGNLPDLKGPPEEPESFPRDYVEQLRDENAKYRQRARTADRLGQRLHTELVRGPGRLADSTDLPYSEEHLAEPGALAAALDDLLARKPHLASRKPVGEIGQGATTSSGSVDLAAILRQRAR